MKVKHFLSAKFIASLQVFLLLFFTFSPVLPLFKVSAEENEVPVDAELDSINIEDNSMVGTEEGDILSTAIGEKIVTYGNIKEEVSYVYPQNESVSIKFLSLPEGQYYLTIEEVETEYGTGYDFSSDLENGTFVANLRLPNTLGHETVEVRFSEDSHEFQSLQNVSTVSESEVVIYNLDHFTIFVITDDQAVYESDDTNPDPDYTEQENRGSAEDPTYGIHYPNFDTAGKTITWQANQASGFFAGEYDVYVSWTVNENRTQEAYYEVNSVSGADLVGPINQELLADGSSAPDGSFSQWYLLGRYELDLNSSVVLFTKDNTSGTEYVIADEVRLVNVPSAPMTLGWNMQGFSNLGEVPPYLVCNEDVVYMNSGNNISHTWTSIEGTNIGYIRNNVRPDGSQILLSGSQVLSVVDPDDLNFIDANLNGSYEQNYTPWGYFGAGDGVYQTRVRAFADLNANTDYDLGEPIGDWGEFCGIALDTEAPQISNVNMYVNGVDTDLAKPGDTVRIVADVIDEVSGVDRVQLWVREYPWNPNNNQLTSGWMTNVSGDTFEFVFTLPYFYQDGDDLNESFEGNYFNFRPYDNAGNSLIGYRDNFTIDATAPVVEITTPGEGEIVSGNVNVFGSVIDQNPMRYYAVVRDSSGVVVAGPGTVYRYDSFTDEFLFDWDTTSVENGQYTIHLAARDMVGLRDNAAGSQDEIIVNVMNVGSIQGRKYEDVNRNGVHDDNTTEPRLNGWNINLYDADWNYLDTSTTGEASLGVGQFRFEDLAFGTYFVCEQLQPSWMQTGPVLGTNPIDFDGIVMNDALAVQNASGNASEGAVCVEFTIDSPDEAYGWVKFGNYMDDEPPIISAFYGVDYNLIVEEEPGVFQSQIYIDVDAEDEISDVVSVSYQILGAGDEVLLSGQMDDAFAGVGDYVCSVFGDVSGEFDTGCAAVMEVVDVSSLASGTYDIRMCAEDSMGNIATGDSVVLPTGDPNYCYRYTVNIDNDAPIVDELEDRTFFEGDPIPQVELNISDNDVSLDELVVTVITPSGDEYTQSYPLSGQSDTVDMGEILKDELENAYSMTLTNDIFDTTMIEEGVYVMQYYATDFTGNSTDLLSVNYTLQNVAPQVNLLANGSDSIVIAEGDEVSFTGLFVDPSSNDAGDDDWDDDAWEVTIDYNDGNVELFDVAYPEVPGSEFVLNHTYENAGTYYVDLVVCEAQEIEESEGQCSFDRVEIVVNNLSPEVVLSASPSIETIEQPITMTANVSGGNSPVLVTKWNCNFSISNPTNLTQTTPDTPGTYFCTVTVQDVDGDMDVSEQLTVVVNSLPEETTTPTTPATSPEASVLGTGDAVEQDDTADEEAVEEEEVLDDGQVLGEMVCDQTSMVSGYVYVDENENQSKDDDEKGLEDISVRLYSEIDGERTMVMVVDTNEDGYWQADVCPGEYEVELESEDLPDEYEFSGKLKGISVGEDGLSDINFEISEKGGSSYWWVLLVVLALVAFALGLNYVFGRRNDQV